MRFTIIDYVNIFIYTKVLYLTRDKLYRVDGEMVQTDNLQRKCNISYKTLYFGQKTSVLIPLFLPKYN